MCGLIGIWSREIASQEDALPQLLTTLEHRGPDETWSSKWNNLRYGCTRLAVVDINKPVLDDSESDSAAVMLNGEIWNYQALAERYRLGDGLSERGVIRLLYERFGRDFIRDLDGIFAIVIVDKLNQKAVVYRDPQGVKPLFWWLDSANEHAIFCSDMKTICRWSKFTPKPNPNYLVNETTFGFSDFDDNAFQGINQLRPSSFLTLSFNGGRVDVSSGAYTPSIQNDTFPITDEVQQLTILQAAVLQQYTHTDHLPIGLLLSGGIDSSLLLFIARSLNLTDIVCFHCGDESTEEFFWATRVAAIAGYELRSFALSASDIWKHLPNACYYMSGIDSMLPHLFRRIKAIYPTIRVMWSGEGADELYAGYPCYVHAKALFGSWHQHLADRKADTGLLNRVAEVDKSLRSEIDAGYALLEFYRNEQLVNNHLVPHDFASMANSIELRLPFLDLRNVMFSRNLSRMQLFGVNRKPILKKVLRKLSGISEDAFYEREKQGLIHSYIGVKHGLRRLCSEAQPSVICDDSERQCYLGPFHAFWNRLVQATFVRSDPTLIGALIGHTVPHSFLLND